MNESDVRRKVIQSLRELDARSVENVVGSGMPDVNYVEGFIELKYLPKWPERASTQVAFPKYYPAQRVWHTERSRAGGNVTLLARIGKDWLLFDGGYAAAFLGGLTKEQMLQDAERVWIGRLNSDEFAAHMRARSERMLRKREACKAIPKSPLSS